MRPGGGIGKPGGMDIGKPGGLSTAISSRPDCKKNQAYGIGRPAGGGPRPGKAGRAGKPGGLESRYYQ